MACILSCVRMGVVTVALIFGIWLILNPKGAIEMQIYFYRFINWEIKPISMAKEIRNTRLMGVGISIFGIIALVYFIMC